jgi:hypothetical protein
MTLETWELALIIGCGTLALLMCAYSVYILMRRRRAPPKPLTKVVVDMEEGRGRKGSATVEKKKGSTTAEKAKEPKTEKKKESKTEKTRDVKTVASSKPTGADKEIIAVKIQPNNYAVTCPGGDKACVGVRKEGVQTIPQPNKLPAPKIRRDSAPSRIAGGRSSAPRV